jgi:hypothetical protein
MQSKIGKSVIKINKSLVMRYCEAIMNTEKNQIEIEENQPVDKSRRRAIGAGIAAPVLLSLSSRPVWAATDCTFSGALSGNMSPNGPNKGLTGDDICNRDRVSTISPGWYTNHETLWSSGIYTPSSKFNSIFTKQPDVGLDSDHVVKKKSLIATISNADPTFLECLKGHQEVVNVTGVISGNTVTVNASVDLNQEVFHYIAALLSAASTKTVFPYSVSQILDDWGVWDLNSKIQTLQASEYSVDQVRNLPIIL